MLGMRLLPTWPALAAAALAVMLAGGQGCGDGRAPIDEAAAKPDSAAGLDVAAAYTRGSKLLASGHARRALPYLRRSLAQSGRSWEAHYQYAAALANASVEGVPGRGLPHPAAHLSIERVAMLREAQAHMDVAERMAPTASDRAIVQRARAGHLATWGLRWDAMEDFDHAASGDSTRWRADAIRYYAEMMRGAGATAH